MSALRVGIIGDGQLGMMLCEAARSLGLRTVMLAGSADGPAARLADTVVVGAMDDTAALQQLIDACDVVTYEREDIPEAAAFALEAAEDAGAIHCRPSLRVIRLLQDKGHQKCWLANNGLATLPFVLSDGSQGKLREALDQLGTPIVQKSLRGGFDGRGVQLLRDPESAIAGAWPGVTLFEQYAGEFTEVAVLVVRGQDGTLAHYGPVDMTFEDSHAVLDTVSAPSRQPPSIQSAAVDLACETIAAMDGVGVFGVELFVLADGSVVINEISPRVHNAGHYSLVACASTQFEQHLRAVCGLPLAATDQRRPAAMCNLLAVPVLHDAGRTEAAGRIPGDQETEVYWYGKSPARRMRKLGHITALGDTAEQALSRALGAREAIWEAARNRQ